MRSIKSRKSLTLRKTANCLTVFRLAVGLPIVVSLGNGNKSLACFLILLAGATDLADGYLARKSGGGSIWGARLDPLADKVLLTAPLLFLAREFVIPIWSLWLLLSRELIISSWRSSNDHGGPASFFGKAKTILQFTSVLFMLWPLNWGGTYFAYIVQKIGCYLFWPALFVALYSAVRYLKPQSNSNQN